MQDDPVRKLKVGGGEWDDSLRKIGHLRSKCYGRITRLIPFFRCAERYFQAFNCNSPGVSGGVSSPIKQPFQAELAYAWFVASGTVTATGMKVQAQSEGGLAIRWAGSDSELWGTTASAKMNTASKLLPTSTYNLKQWTYAKAKEAKNKTADPTTWADVTEAILGTGKTSATFVEGNKYVVMHEFEIRSTSEAEPAKGLYVSGVQATGSAKDIDKSLRVGVRLLTTDGNGPFFIYGPVAGATNSYTWTDGKNTSTTQTVTLATVGTAEDTNSQLLVNTAEIPGLDDTPTKVEIYIWYEGEDAQLYSDNYAANALDVSVQFSSYGFKTA
ncbi:MAG: hypothetical protein SO355_01865 [Candidatus Faecousia sp.]|nr:hypothetical protein [Candidatus Faecousia sp.]